MGGFQFAYFIRGYYGGAMVLSDGTENLVFGTNLGVAGCGAGVLTTLIAIILDQGSKMLYRKDLG
jgi:hypothetical protein